MEKSTIFNGQSTISMVIFNSKLLVITVVMTIQYLKQIEPRLYFFRERIATTLAALPARKCPGAKNWRLLGDGCDG